MKCTTVLATLMMLTGCNMFTNVAPAPTPTVAPVSFTTLNLGLPQQALQAPIIGTVPDDQVLHVNVTLKVDQAALAQLGASNAQASTTSVPNLAQKLGISDQHLKQIQDYFGIEHITVQPNKARTNLTFSAKAGSIAHLLYTRFVVHKGNGRTFFTPDPAQMPKIPTSIAPYILAINGLDSYSLPPVHKSALQDQQLTHLQAHHQGNADCVNFYPFVATPAKVASAYGYSRLWSAGWHGENMTVNLVEMDGFDSNDLSNYFACTGSRARLDYVNMGATAPAPGIESMIDIEMLAGLAPAVHMIDYQMDPALLNGTYANWWTAFNDALQQIIDNNQNNTHAGSSVSISLGQAEDEMSQDVLLAVNQNLQILTQAEHMTVLVASGDCGAFDDGVYGGQKGVDFPASAPWSVGVGGTQMTFAANGIRTNEMAWSSRSDLSVCHNTWGSGGGVSQFFDRPSFQQGAGVDNTYTTGKRQVPDISAVAVKLPLYFKGQWGLAFGTSAATPIWAAGLALVNQGMMIRKHLFYYGPATFYYIANHAGSLHPYTDITSGENLYYQATPGWDYTSGLGTPGLMDFFNILYAAS